jgi:drug/metabolite transporter (DMT)-like permease
VPASALLLALGAAGLHALWNVLLAGARDTDAATAVMLLAAIVLFAPVAAVTWRVEWAAAPYIAGSAAFELAYFALLARAYRRSELSLVYPLARGIAPVLVLAVSVLALAAATSVLEAGGVVLVGIGVMLVRGLRRSADSRGVGFAIAIGACIAAYTLLDKEGIAHAGAITYLELVTVGPAIAYGIAMLATKGAPALRAELRPRTIVAALALLGAYTLVLVALDLAPAAPVAAVRESSVLLATLLAALVLEERVSPARAAGAALIVAGIVLVGLS